MNEPLVLVVDDSATIRAMVISHLAEAGYRVESAPDAEHGVALASELRPDLILLDHQLPGTTGEEVVRRLLDDPRTARIPVVISSTLRNKAFARYADYPNVVDQLPKPVTPEALKAGVAGALQLGAMVVQAQEVGGAIPEVVGSGGPSILSGHTSGIPIRAVLDLLNQLELRGTLALEAGSQRFRFALAGGKIQGVFSTTIHPESIVAHLPAEFADLAPLLPVTLAERSDSSMEGVIRLLERSLSDPKRLRGLLRIQSAVLARQALVAEPGPFAFEADREAPPMFRAFPQQISLLALAVEGFARTEPIFEPSQWASRVLARKTARGANLDRSGLDPHLLKALTLLDGTTTLERIAERAGVSLADAVSLARGLELLDLVETRDADPDSRSVLVVEADPESVRSIQRSLGAEGRRWSLKLAPDRIAAQVLARRGGFDLILVAVDRPEQETLARALRTHTGEATRVVGITRRDGEGELERLEKLGIDGVLHGPVQDGDLALLVQHAFGG